MRVPVPDAATEKVAVAPIKTLWLVGWVVIVGGRFTANVTVLLVAVPPELETFTEKVEPLSVPTVAGVVYEEAMAPEIADPFFDHW